MSRILGTDIGNELQLPEAIFDEEDQEWVNTTSELERGSNLNIDEYVQPEIERNYVPLSEDLDSLERALEMYPVEVQGGVS
jgi:hypothetical protein